MSGRIMWGQDEWREEKQEVGMGGRTEGWKRRMWRRQGGRKGEMISWELLQPASHLCSLGRKQNVA